MGVTRRADDSMMARRRTCSLPGCAQPVKKATAKYCSVGCCSSDPQRIAMLRERSRNSSRMVLPMARQLTIPFATQSNPEDFLVGLCAGREDTPGGMSRLAV